jgi:hypothetical protein
MKSIQQLLQNHLHTQIRDPFTWVESVGVLKRIPISLDWLISLYGGAVVHEREKKGRKSVPFFLCYMEVMKPHVSIFTFVRFKSDFSGTSVVSFRLNILEYLNFPICLRLSPSIHMVKAQKWRKSWVAWFGRFLDFKKNFIVNIRLVAVYILQFRKSERGLFVFISPALCMNSWFV